MVVTAPSVVKAFHRSRYPHCSVPKESIRQLVFTRKLHPGAVAGLPAVPAPLRQLPAMGNLHFQWIVDGNEYYPYKYYPNEGSFRMGTNLKLRPRQRNPIRMKSCLPTSFNDLERLSNENRILFHLIPSTYIAHTHLIATCDTAQCLTSLDLMIDYPLFRRFVFRFE